jgi:beta-glucuronidase
MITEFGADTLLGAHNTPAKMWTEEYQLEFLRGFLDVAAQRSFMAGMHVWNCADCKTDQGTMRAAAMNFTGVFTRDRRPKMAAYVLRALGRKGRDEAHLSAATLYKHGGKDRRLQTRCIVVPRSL